MYDDHRHIRWRLLPCSLDEDVRGEGIRDGCAWLRCVRSRGIVWGGGFNDMSEVCIMVLYL